MQEVKPQNNFSLKILPLIAFLIPLIIYILTLAPTYLPPDGAEFTLCIQYIGICHPPGFFLYVLLGKLFITLFPFGTLIYKVNFLSAFYASITIVIIYLLLCKLKVQNYVALFTSFIFAFSSTFWGYATSADVFSFGVFLLCLVLYTFLNSQYILSFFLLGLLTSHFPNSVIFLFIISWFLIVKKKTSYKNLLTYFSAFLLGVAPIIVLLYLRMVQQPFINWDHITSLSNFFNYLSRKEFGGIFVISNPVYVFTFTNFFSHLSLFSYTLFIQFDMILPFIAIIAIIKNKLFRSDKVIFLLYSFFFFLFFTILSLSSINPFNDSENFQFDKFYLSSFVFFILLVGVSLTQIQKNNSFKKYLLPVIVIIFVVQLVSNFASHNLSEDYYSEDMITNSLNELPSNAIVITINNQNYFESLYEQSQNNKYKNLTFVYFPNNSNKDFQKYHPELFTNDPDNRVAFLKKKSTNSTYKAIIDIIARNPSRPVFIWQGASEESIIVDSKVFNSIVVPFGLWWKVNDAHNKESNNLGESKRLLNDLGDTYLIHSGLSTYQKKSDITVYTRSFFSTGSMLAQKGDFPSALSLLNKAHLLNPVDTTIINEIAAINDINNLASSTDQLIQLQDEPTLLRLAADYYQIKDYNKCIDLYKKIITFDPQSAETYSNLGSVYALINDKKNALFYFDKALQINPNLDFAIKGKQNVVNNN